MSKFCRNFCIAKVQTILEEEKTALDEIVVSASRTPETIRESPVVERMTVKG
jgi:phosphoribosylcarboxyaminoimidazole (NCAIR) mutase